MRNQGCRASPQLWLGLEPLVCFVPSTHHPQDLRNLELLSSYTHHHHHPQMEEVWRSAQEENGRDEFASSSFFPMTPLQTILSKM